MICRASTSSWNRAPSIGDVADVRVQRRHQVQRLHHVRAVLAGQRDRGLEQIVAVQRLDLRDGLGAPLDGWPPTCSRASTSEVNSWPIGMPAKVTPHVGAGAADRERRFARIVVIAAHDSEILSDSAAMSLQQRAHLPRLGAVVERPTSSIGWVIFGNRPSVAFDGVVQHACSCGELADGQDGGPTPTVGTRPLAGDCTPRVPKGPEPRAHPEEAGAGEVRSCRRGRATGRGSSSPSSHLAGQTSPGCAATYWAALTLRSSSPASRPTPPALTSTSWITPSGSTTKVPRSARPASSISTSKLRVIVPVGSPTMGYWILPMVSEVSCQALWVKWVSVETA